MLFNILIAVDFSLGSSHCASITFTTFLGVDKLSLARPFVASRRPDVIDTCNCRSQTRGTEGGGAVTHACTAAVKLAGLSTIRPFGHEQRAD